MTTTLDTLEAVHNLVGIRLPEGWTVTEKIEKALTDTGGCFSVCYFIQDDLGNKAFLKVLNLAKVRSMPGDELKNIEHLIATFNYERTALDICKDFSFKRVATALFHGNLRIPGSLIGVYYIAFELAEGCVRKHMAKIGALDKAWILRSLHQTANGIRELHTKGIAHQDLKPSNVLIYGEVGSKVADLGCADIRGSVSPRGGYKFAGDPSYAPIELRYGEVSSSWEERRLAADMYLFGSLVAFLFTQVTMTSYVIGKLHHGHRPGFWAHGYRTALPYVRNAYGSAMDDITALLPEEMRPELSSAIRFLCDPDPLLRGERSYRGSEQYSFERVVSIFNRLAFKAEISVR